MHRIAVVSFALAFPFVALAQTPTPPPPQPTPPPGWVAPNDDNASPSDEVATPSSEVAPEPAPALTPHPEPRAVDTLPKEMLSRPVFGKPAISPTLALALGIRSVKNHPERGTTSLDTWFGVRFHPAISVAAPFMAMGTEINFRTAARAANTPLEQEDVSYAEFVPEVRWGFAWLRTPHTDYSNTVIPNLELYGITGWRIANRVDGHAMRVGVGVSSPALMVLGAACQAPLPAMLEVTMDVDSMYSGEREYAVRFGWHF